MTLNEISYGISNDPLSKASGETEVIPGFCKGADYRWFARSRLEVSDEIRSFGYG